MPKRPVPATHFPSVSDAIAASNAAKSEMASGQSEAVDPSEAFNAVADRNSANLEQMEQPTAEAAPAESPAIEVVPDETCAPECAAANIAPADRVIPGCAVLKFGLPMKESTGYAPQAISMTLTPKLARTLADFAEGLRSMGIKINHPTDAIKRLLEAMNEGGTSRLFFAEGAE